MENDVVIYALIDPTNQLVRYIGSSLNPIKRLKQHIQGSKFYLKEYQRSKKPEGRFCLPEKDSWINELLERGFVPGIQPLLYCASDERHQAELNLIRHFRALKYPLTNDRWHYRLGVAA